MYRSESVSNLKSLILLLPRSNSDNLILKKKKKKFQREPWNCSFQLWITAEVKVTPGVKRSRHSCYLVPIHSELSQLWVMLVEEKDNKHWNIHSVNLFHPTWTSGMFLREFWDSDSFASFGSFSTEMDLKQLLDKTAVEKISMNCMVASFMS